MKETYKVADIVFSVEVSGKLPAWKAIGKRYYPFLLPFPERPKLEIRIAAGSLPGPAGECVYEPIPNGIGFVTARVSRSDNDTLAMEFAHKEEKKPRLLMTMTPQLDKADITIAGAGHAPDDGYFLTHAIMIAFMLAASRVGTLLVHASAVVCDGKAYLFQGKSGTGKSTHSSLWLRNIAGTELLNDDNPAVGISEEGVAMAYGTPWSGKTDCYRNVASPVGAFVRIVRGKDNELRLLSPLHAYASLTASTGYIPLVGEEQRSLRHKTLERLIQSASCCEMHCRPDADAARVCHDGVMAHAKSKAAE